MQHKTPQHKSVVYFIAITLTALILVLPSCRKNKDKVQPTDTTGATLTDVVNMLNVQQEAALKFEEVWKSNHDTLAAIFEMAKWIMTQPGVKRVYMVEDYSVGIMHNSGLWSSIAITMVGAQGQHLTRQGGSAGTKGSIQKYTFGRSSEGDDDNIIGSKKVMLFVPFNNQFYNGAYNFLPKFEEAKTKLEVTLVTEQAATFQLVKTFHEYGFIILNTHGDIDGSFQVYTGVDALDIPVHPEAGKFTNADVESYIAQSGNEVLELILNGKLNLGTSLLVDLFNSASPVTTSVKLNVTDEYIRDMPNKLKDAVVFGNHCYSGNTDVFTYQEGINSGQLPSAWLSAGAVAYYGYAFSDGASRAVDNDFCRKMEDSLITNLVINGDSTGTAHLANDVSEQFYEVTRIKPLEERGEALQAEVTVVMVTSSNLKTTDELYLKLFHSPRYKYGCGTFTDPRDQQKYELACINGKTWFAENLRYSGGGAGICYDNNSVNCDKYGRLYTLAEATGQAVSEANPSGIQGICPEFWHVPSKAEWEELIAFCGGINEAAKKLNATTDWPEPNDYTNELGLTLLPSGNNQEDPNNGNLAFTGLGTSNAIWTTSGNTAGTLHYALANMGLFLYSPPPQAIWRLSCRCVKD